VLAKFPDAAVEEWAPVLFLPLVARLVNDPDAGARAAVGATLRVLLQARRPGLLGAPLSRSLQGAHGSAPPVAARPAAQLSARLLSGRVRAQRVSGGTRDRLAAFCERWLAGGDARARRAALQALGLLADAEGGRASRRVPGLLPPLAAALHAAAGQVRAGRTRSATSSFSALLGTRAHGKSVCPWRRALPSTRVQPCAHLMTPGARAGGGRRRRGRRGCRRLAGGLLRLAAGREAVYGRARRAGVAGLAFLRA